MIDTAVLGPDLVLDPEEGPGHVPVLAEVLIKKKAVD